MGVGGITRLVSYKIDNEKIKEVIKKLYFFLF